ncbi:MAG: RloB family protein [Pseudomonadota bacterium]
MAKRNAPAPPSLKRRGAVRPPKIALLIFSEGQNTEPEYLKGFARAHGNGLVKIKIVAPAGVPMTIVDSASEAKSQVARSKDSFAEYDQIWAVFDRDEHENVEQAISIAKSRGVKVAFSNPCFEVWLLLHHVEYDADEHRKQTQKRYQGIDKGYDPSGSKSVDLKSLIGGYDEACRRAKRMRARREEERTPKGAPYTDVDVLTELIRENGRGT